MGNFFSKCDCGSEDEARVNNSVKGEQAPFKVLMVLTSNNKFGDKEGETGWYLPEAAHPYFVFADAGVHMTWASPKGGQAPLDPSSIEASKEDPQCVEFASKEELKALWTNTTPLADCQASDYDAVFVVGGFGVMWDLPDNVDMQRLGRDIYEAGGIVSAVCHGPAAFVHTKLSDGELLVKGKKISAFTNAEEDIVQKRNVVPFTLEDKFTEIGAEYIQSAVFQEQVSVDQRVVSGQNPASAKKAAMEVVKMLQSSRA